MTCQTTTGDVVACTFLAIALFAGSLVPFFLLINAEHLLPRPVRELPLTSAALLLILTAPKGATR